MENEEAKYNRHGDLKKQLEAQTIQLEELRYRLEEANETIEAIRTGQIDALVVKGNDGHQLYTLRTADQTYRVFIEKMAEGAVTLNRQGTILYSNTQFASMVNMSLSKVIGLSLEQFIAAENKPWFKELFTGSWEADCKGEVFIAGAEESRPVQLSFTTLELEEGIALSVIVTDLRHQKAIQEQLKHNNNQLAEINLQLEASNHDLLQFASVASHDLQEPLRKIQIFSSLLQQGGNSLSKDSQRYLERIIDSTARMKTLIIEILNYSRLSANDNPLEMVDLGKVAREAAEDFDLLMAEKKATITIDKLPSVEANSGQVRQVFQNIISNALKFSKSCVPPEIIISGKRIGSRSFDSEAQQDGAFCLVTIADNGIGFDNRYVASIFALFERLNSKDKFEGTGIGMAIAKKIIDKHNGLITASGEEGKGAIFKIILPVKQAGL